MRPAITPEIADLLDGAPGGAGSPTVTMAAETKPSVGWVSEMARSVVRTPSAANSGLGLNSTKRR